MVHLKPYIKEMFITEGLGDWVNGAGEWLKDEAGKAINGTTEFFTTSLSGIQKMVGNISSGQWSEVINLLKSGALYVARKIRGALYNPIGLILDAILVASGVGKGVQSVIWGIVVALDIYELTTGNYEDKSESFLMRLLFTGIDLIGLVGAGFGAKTSKSLVTNVIRKFGTSEKGLGKAVQSSPKFKSLLETILNSVTSAGSRMGKVNSYLKTKSPMLYKFVSSVLSSLGKFIMKIVTSIKAILSGTFKVISAPGKAIEKSLGSGSKLGKGAKAGVNTTALVGGFGTYEKVDSNNKNKEIINAVQSTGIKPNYDNIEW
jgi:hypothetical protein